MNNIILLITIFLFCHTTVMATSYPVFPVPTPYQPPSHGGNPNVPVGVQGPMIGTNFIGPVLPASGAPVETGTTHTIPEPQQQPGSSQGSYTPPAQQTVPSDFGGGGTGTDITVNGVHFSSEKDQRLAEEEARRKGFNSVAEYRAYAAQQESDYYNEINNTFNESNAYLDRNVALAEDARTAANAAVRSDEAANLSELGVSKQENIDSLAKQERAGQTRYEDASAKARRIWQEMTIGNQQRFGGASGAGRAMSEIQGAEMQRQMGANSRQFNEFSQEAEVARNFIETKYQDGLVKVKQITQNAIANVQQNFTNALMQINNLKSANAREKGEAKLNALKAVRDQVMQLKSQEVQQQQALELMREQQLLNTKSYNETESSVQSPTFSSGNYSQPGLSTNSQSNELVGQIGLSTNSGNMVWDPAQRRMVPAN